MRSNIIRPIIRPCIREVVQPVIGGVRRLGGGVASSDPVAVLQWRSDSVTGSSGSYVLADLSGNGHDATQSSGSMTPGTGANSQPKYTCVAAQCNAGLSAVIDSFPQTVITVMKRTEALTGMFGDVGVSSTDSLWCGVENTNSRSIYIKTVGGVSQSTDSGDIGAVTVFTDFIAHKGLAQSKDGLFLSAVNSTPESFNTSYKITPSLGTDYRRLYGDWYETRVYNKILTPDELDFVTAEINERYGLSNPLWSDYTTKNVVFIGGQSNAAGRAPIASLPAEYQGDQAATKIYTASGWATLNSNVTANNGSGPSRFGYESIIGKEYADLNSEDLWIFKYAPGGSMLANEYAAGGSWSPIATGAVVINKQFDEMCINWFKALRFLQIDEIKPNLLGLTWFQGEEDATSVTASAAYAANLTSFISEVESLFGKTNKWFVMRIADEGDGDYTTEVRAAQSSVASSISRVNLVDVDSYSMLDAVHLSATGQVSLGTYLAGQL